MDLLNPDATARFLGLTHERYASVLSKHFGKTVKFTFSDEPAAGMPQPPNSVPWFPGLPQAYVACHKHTRRNADGASSPIFRCSSSSLASEFPLPLRARVWLYTT